LFHLEVARGFGDRARGGSEAREDPDTAWCCERLIPRSAGWLQLSTVMLLIIAIVGTTVAAWEA
jgi:hypothetical protein